MSNSQYDTFITEFDACKLAMFDRYDVDGSGTINNDKELSQLCTNLCIKLGFVVKVDTIKEWCNESGDLVENPWSLREFSTYFKRTFIARVADDAPANAETLEEEDDDASVEKIVRAVEIEVGTLYHHVLADDDDSCWVMTFPNEEHERNEKTSFGGYDDEQKQECREVRNTTLRALLRAGDPYSMSLA